MAQLVHAIAPDAELYFATPYPETKLGEAITPQYCYTKCRQVVAEKIRPA